MGEGAGVMILEALALLLVVEGQSPLIRLQELEHALARKAPIYAHLSSYSATADAHHSTQPPSDGHGAYRAMVQALKTAGLEASDVDYINAHATSTRLGDAAETRAIERLMAGNENRCLVSSTKGATGHLLGAAGAVEAIFTVMAIKSVTSNYESRPSCKTCSYQRHCGYSSTLLTCLTGYRTANTQFGGAFAGLSARLHSSGI